MNSWNANGQFTQDIMQNVPPLLPPQVPLIMDDMVGNRMQMDNIGPQGVPPGMVTNDQNQMFTDHTNEDQGGQRQSGRRGSRDRRDLQGSRAPRRRSRDRHDRDRSRIDDGAGDRSRTSQGMRERGDYGGKGRGGRSERTRTNRWDNSEPDGMGASSMGGAGPMAGNGHMTQGVTGMPQGNMMMPGAGQMMQFPAGMYNNGLLGQTPMDMQNLPNMMGLNAMMGSGNPAMPNMMMDQGMMGSMYPQMNHMMGGMMPMTNQLVYLSNAVLLPPISGASLPERRDKPPGCCTIFVGGLPDNINEEILMEIFQKFGKIKDMMLNRKGFCHIRFAMPESVEASFTLTGYRFRFQDQIDAEATTLFLDYALNRDDQVEYERSKRAREPTPPRIEPFTTTALTAIADKIKSEDHFAEAAPTLAGWLERGECSKKNANAFYSLIQASNNQVRRLFNEKMQVDEELANLKSSLRDKFQRILTQFEQVAKILAAARLQRVWDHFSKQQRRNIEMWQKMSSELDTMKEEFNAYFDEEDDKPDKSSSKKVWEEKYEELKRENETLQYELVGYKNEAYVAKEEAERKFEKFKAQFIAQQALQGAPQVFPPLPSTPDQKKFKPPQPVEKEEAPSHVTGIKVPTTEARLISVITAFLLVHPLGASVDYIVSYVRSILPKVSQATVNDILQKYNDVFAQTTTGVGASIERRWTYVTFDTIKAES